MTKENKVPNSGSISKKDFNKKKFKKTINRNAHNRANLFANAPKTPEIVKRKLECPGAPKHVRNIETIFVPFPIHFPNIDHLDLPTTPITMRRRIECPDAPKKSRHF